MTAHASEIGVGLILLALALVAFAGGVWFIACDMAGQARLDYLRRRRETSTNGVAMRGTSPPWPRNAGRPPRARPKVAAGLASYLRRRQRVRTPVTPARANGGNASLLTPLAVAQGYGGRLFRD